MIGRATAAANDVAAINGRDEGQRIGGARRGAVRGRSGPLVAPAQAGGQERAARALDMTASITAMWATIILAALGAFFAGPGLGVLIGILGTTLVVVLAMREENEKARDARRRVLREAAWRETARAMRENGEQA
jgi:hypothetical protein